MLKLEKVDCAVCGTANGELVAQGKDFEYSTSDDTFQCYKCNDCGNLYLDPRPSMDSLAVIYPSNYYSYNYDQAVHPLARAGKDFLDKAKIKRWLSYLGNRPRRFALDVGCGNGRYLRVLEEFGFPKSGLYGVEMSAEQIERLNADGFRGFNGTLEQVANELPAGQFDLLVLLQVLEHVAEPKEMMKTLYQLLAPGGILIIETPNTASLDFQLFRRRYWGGYHFPRHWNLFDCSVLRRLAEDSGLELLAFNFLPAQTFWIYSLHNYFVDQKGLRQFAKYLNPFQNIPLLCLFTGFDILRAKLGFKTSNVQMVARRPG